MTKINAMTVSNATSASNAFDVVHAIKAVNKLRTDAANNHAKYEVAGRKAMLQLMQRVYTQFYEANNSDSFEDFMNNIRNCLKQGTAKPRKSSPNSSLLVRYVFADFTDKQVCVYGRSLQVGIEDHIAPQDYIAFIDESGGFEGVRKAGLDSKKASNNTPEIALSYAKLETTVNTVDIKDWKSSDEDFRVYIAIRGDDDDTAALKDAKLTDERLKAVLRMYCTNKRELEKRTAKPKHTAAIKPAAQAAHDAANALAEKHNIEAALEKAITSNDEALCDKLRSDLDWVTEKLEFMTKSANRYKSGADVCLVA